MKVSQEQLKMFYESMNEANEHQDPSSTSTDHEAKCCLISNTPLDEHAISMECGHTFNYIPLYYDLVNHKNKFNLMEKKILKYDQLRCPYCRHVQNALLPYKELPYVEKIHGVNYIDEQKMMNKTHIWMAGTCEYQEMIQKDGLWISMNCPNTYVTHVPLLNNYFCAHHKYKAIQKHTKDKKAQEKQKKKDEAKAKKEKEKQEKQKKKDEAKVMKAEAKANKEKPKPETEPQPPATPTSSSTHPFCMHIFVSGNKKGELCSCKVFENGLCKRHYTMVTKKYTPPNPS